MEVKPLDAAAAELSEKIKDLAHPARLRIVCALARGEATVSSLAESTGTPIPAMSRHLALLRRGGIVTARRAQRTIVYALDDSRIARFVSALAEIFCAAGPAAR